MDKDYPDTLRYDAWHDLRELRAAFSHWQALTCQSSSLLHDRGIRLLLCGQSQDSQRRLLQKFVDGADKQQAYLVAKAELKAKLLARRNQKNRRNHKGSNAKKERVGCGKHGFFLRKDLDSDFAWRVDAASTSTPSSPDKPLSVSEGTPLRSGGRATLAGREALLRKTAAVMATADKKQKTAVEVQEAINQSRNVFREARTFARLPAPKASNVPAATTSWRTIAQPRAPKLHYRACASSTSEEVSADDELFELSVAMLSGLTIELSVYSGHTIYHIKDELRLLDGKNYQLIAPGQDEAATEWQTLFDLGIGPEANCLFATFPHSRMCCENCNMRFRIDASLSRRRLEHCSGLHLGEWDERSRSWSCCLKNKRGSPGCAKGHLHSWAPCMV